MAKISGALLSLSAGGTIGKAITFSKWKGVPYARQRVVPANPQTTAQTTTRTTFANASNIWKAAAALLTDGWNTFALGQPLTGRNAFMSEFVSRLRGEADLTNMIFSPSAKGGTPLDAITPTPGSSEISVAVTPPTPPTGWTLASVTAAAIVDQDPETMDDYAVTIADNDTGPYTVVLSGLTPATLYRVAAWPVWTRPDGTVAYGQSISTTATPTA